MTPSMRTSAIGWSPEKELWDELEKVGGDLSWRRVDFDSNQSDQLPRNDRGVYLICAAPPGSTISIINAYTILYAGRVKSDRRGFRSRFREHLNNPSRNLQLFRSCYYHDIHFWFAATDDESQIDKLEILLIEAFNPPCNSIRAPGTRPMLARLGTGKAIRANNKPQVK